jgi:hypothetical protein
MRSKIACAACLALLSLVGGSGCAQPVATGKIGGEAKAGTPIGHWVSNGTPPVEIVFHDSGELTWMEETEEAGSWKQEGKDGISLTRLNREDKGTFAISGDQMTLNLEGSGSPLTLKRQ